MLYEEVQALNLSEAAWMFSVPLGDGSGVRQESYSWNLIENLSNRITHCQMNFVLVMKRNANKLLLKRVVWFRYLL